MFRMGELPVKQAHAYLMQVAHDDWCCIHKGKTCNCDPDIELIPLIRIPSLSERSMNLPSGMWPTLHQDALYGLPGEIVRAIDPHTEADPVAVLIQSLVCFGNLTGRSPHYKVDAADHYTNLFSNLVGKTSKARKGTSLARVCRLFELADIDWSRDKIQKGLSSGEGLIHAVRDPNTRTGQPGMQHDNGVDDKRLLVVESEFASVLKIMGREGNTLSPIIRECWDSGNLQCLQRQFPLRATAAHISIIGHITQEELRRCLNATEAANGFANRFLWVCVRRSKCLPDGGTLDQKELSQLQEQLKTAVLFAQSVREMVRDEAARNLWHEVYPELSEGKPGLVGAIISRSEAQVLRLSCIYALMDCSSVIQIEHLKAALALCQFCEDSVRWIYGEQTGNPDADQILAALQNAPDGLTLSEIHKKVFHNHKNAQEVEAALLFLDKQSLADECHDIVYRFKCHDIIYAARLDRVSAV